MVCHKDAEIFEEGYEGYEGTFITNPHSSHKLLGKTSESYEMYQKDVQEVKEETKIKTLLMPTILSGPGGVPEEDAAKYMLLGIRNWIVKNDTGSLETITICVSNNDAL